MTRSPGISMEELNSGQAHISEIGVSYTSGSVRAAFLSTRPRA